MASKSTCADRRHRAITADGTVKQQNLLTGAEVGPSLAAEWPSLSRRAPTAPPIDHERLTGHYCAFCSKRYLETPPENRASCAETTAWEQLLDALLADKLRGAGRRISAYPQPVRNRLLQPLALNQAHASEADRHPHGLDIGLDGLRPRHERRARGCWPGHERRSSRATAIARLQAANAFSPAATT